MAIAGVIVEVVVAIERCARSRGRPQQHSFEQDKDVPPMILH